MHVNVVVSPFYLADELSRLMPVLAAGLIKSDLTQRGHDAQVHDLRPLISTRNRWREYLNSSRSWVMEVPHLRVIDRLRHKFASGASVEALVELDEGDRRAIFDLSMDLCTSPIDNLKTFEAVHRLAAEQSRKLLGSDVVVLTAAIYTNLYSDVLLGFLIKRQNPDVHIIIGGPSVYQSENLARYLALCGAFDAVGMGDAEPILGPYLEALDEGRDPSAVAGVITHKGWDAPYLPAPPTDLRDVPTPDFRDLDPMNYLPFALPIHATRGCPYRCRYCSEHRDRFNYMPVEQVVRDIRTLQARHRARLFFFCDSLLNGNRQWFHNLCEELSGLNIRWVSYMRGGSKRTMTADQIAHIARAGCYLMRMGVDSLEPAILKDMARPQNTEGILDEIELLNDAGIHVDANIITGFPGETRDMVGSTISRIRGLTRVSDRRFLKSNKSFFQHLVDSGYREMPVEKLASIMVNIYPFHVRPGSRIYDDPAQDDLTFEFFDPKGFGYPMDDDVVGLIQRIPDSFEGDVAAQEILQRVRVINRSLAQPCTSISTARETAVILWLYATCLEPQDVIGPLEDPQILLDGSNQPVLFVPNINRHLPLIGGLRRVIHHLLAHGQATLGEMAEDGDEQALRNAVSVLIVAGLLPRPRLAAPPSVADGSGVTARQGGEPTAATANAVVS